MDEVQSFARMRRAWFAKPPAFPDAARDRCKLNDNMTTASSLPTELRDVYGAESARIREAFYANGDGRAAVRERTALVNGIVLRLWKEYIEPQDGSPKDFALVALGGYGRGSLFPHSDIDLLFLHADNNGEKN